MSDYISRKGVLSLLQPFEPDQNGYPLNGGIEYARTMVEAVPTIDAVEVVRCKDCTEHQYCRLEQRLGWYGYCSEGERKNDG